MRSDRVLVTGATGFVGAWILRRLREAHPEAEVWATSELPDPTGLGCAHYRRADLRNRDEVATLVGGCRPSFVIHLASLISGGSLEEYLAVNVIGTANLYRAVLEAAPAARVLQIGSAAEYGLVRPDELPITEEQPLRPVTEYALSKVAQEHLAVVVGMSRGLSIVRARIFNLVGPGQPDHLVPATFVRQLIAVRDGRADTLKVGDVSARRDFVDVRDAVDALDTLLYRGEPGSVYNVGSGRDASVREIIDELMEISGVRPPVTVEATRMRPADVPVVRAHVSKMRDAFGWQTRISLPSSLAAMWTEAAAGAGNAEEGG